MKSKLGKLLDKYSTIVLGCSVVLHLLMIACNALSARLADYLGRKAMLSLLQNHYQSTSAAAISESSSLWWVPGSSTFDVGRVLLPSLHAPWLPDLVVVSLILGCVWDFVRPPRGLWKRRLSLLLVAHSIILFMRMSTIISTFQIPSPYCSEKIFPSIFRKVQMSMDNVSVEWRNYFQENEVGFMLNTGCFDLMFSGHVSVSLLLAFYWQGSPHYSWAVKLLGWFLLIASIAVNIMVGDHFTSDIIIASYITTLIYLVFRKHLHDTYDLTFHRSIQTHHA